MSFIEPVNVLFGNTEILGNEDLHGRGTELYLRPHDIEVQMSSNGTSIPARIERIIHLGWEIQVELLLSDRQRVTAHFSREKFDGLGLEASKTVFAKPKTNKAFC
jgi:sulfate/thiosulfate transport system ATP-binding protein